MEAIFIAMTAVLAILEMIYIISAIKQIAREEKEQEELRRSYELCSMCKDRNECPAAFTGVAYPCEHVRMEENYER